MVIAIIFIILAAICNAVMDTLKHHYYVSIFRYKFGINNTFWNEDNINGKPPYFIPYTKYKLNAWHLFKSGMICFLLGAVVMAHRNGEAIFNVWWFYIVEYIYFGLTWNGTFNLFYNHLLKQ